MNTRKPYPSDVGEEEWSLGDAMRLIQMFRHPQKTTHNKQRMT